MSEIVLNVIAAGLWLFAVWLGYRVMIAPMLAKPRPYVDHVEPRRSTDSHPTALWPSLADWFGKQYTDD